MPSTNPADKWLEDEHHPLRPVLEGIIRDDISVDQFLAELWFEGYKISPIEEKDIDRHTH